MFVGNIPVSSWVRRLRWGDESLLYAGWLQRRAIVVSLRSHCCPCALICFLFVAAFSVAQCDAGWLTGWLADNRWWCELLAFWHWFLGIGKFSVAAVSWLTAWLSLIFKTRPRIALLYLLEMYLCGGVSQSWERNGDHRDYAGHRLCRTSTLLASDFKLCVVLTLPVADAPQLYSVTAVLCDQPRCDVIVKVDLRIIVLLMCLEWLEACRSVIIILKWGWCIWFWMGWWTCCWRFHIWCLQ